MFQGDYFPGGSCVYLPSGKEASHTVLFTIYRNKELYLCIYYYAKNRTPKSLRKTELKTNSAVFMFLPSQVLAGELFVFIVMLEKTSVNIIKYLASPAFEMSIFAGNSIHTN